MTMSKAALDVLAERRRQIEIEGFAPERDDTYVQGELGRAGACYALGTQVLDSDLWAFWPEGWDRAWWRPGPDRRRDLVKAGALILAEIERLDRKADGRRTTLMRPSLNSEARTPTDGQPFYCRVCGSGYSEYMACDSPECSLESIEEAKERATQKNGHVVDDPPHGVSAAGDVMRHTSYASLIERHAMTEPGTVVRHLKTGGEYEVIDLAVLQSAEPISDMAGLVAYRARRDNSIWVRPVGEFTDGRFVTIAGAVKRNPGHFVTREEVLRNEGVSSEELRRIDPVHPSFIDAVMNINGMGDLLADVRAFHEACDVPVLLELRIVPERIELRRELVREEVREFNEALDERNPVKLADAIADVIYVLVGTSLEFGIPLHRVWAEVQRSNMAKVDPATGKVTKRPDGKVLKPKGWTPPDIAGALDLGRPVPPHGSGPDNQ